MVVVALGLAAETLRTGIATALKDHDPLLAARIAPDNARIAVAAARRALPAKQDVRAPLVSQLVERALARDVTVPAGLEFRALQFEAAGQNLRAAALFDLSSAISRRSLPTRLWLIQQAVDRGDVKGALANFDVALRTSTDAPDILFPVLARAASDPGLVEPIARMLDRPSDWRIMFLFRAIKEGGDPRDIGAVVLAMRNRDSLRDGQIDQMLIARLVEENHFRLARQVSDAFLPGGATSGLVSDPGFARPDLRFPFGWDLSQSGEAWAARDRVDGRPALLYQASPNDEGAVARQLLTLGPGSYQLLANVATTAGEPGESPVWTVTCAGRQGNPIARLQQPRTSGSMAAVGFIVPAGCEGQWLALTVAPGGQSGAVARVDIRRSQSSRVPAAIAASRSARVGALK